VLLHLQVEWFVATGDEDYGQNLTCKAVKKTWTNQRRKRRLACQQQQTTSKKLKELSELKKDEDKDISSIIPQEIPIESCDLEFTCILNRTDANSVQFKWLRGDSKDSLHQITQYLKNQAQLIVQTKNQ